MRETVGAVVPGDARPFFAVPCQQSHEEVGDFSLCRHFPDEYAEFAEIDCPLLEWHRIPLGNRTGKCHDVLAIFGS